MPTTAPVFTRNTSTDPAGLPVSDSSGSILRPVSSFQVDKDVNPAPKFTQPHVERGERLVKKELVSRIDAIVRNRGITQTEAARLMGLFQPDASRLPRGDFREHSLEHLFRMLNALGRDVDIVIRQPRSPDCARLHISPMAV